MARRKIVIEARERLISWAPWIARLNTALGLSIGAEGRKFLQKKMEEAETKRQADAAARALEALATAAPPSPTKTPGKKPQSALKSSAKPAPAAAKKANLKAEPAPVSPTASLKAPEAEEAVPLEGSSPPIVSLMHLARAATAACRGHAWHELLNTIRHLWNNSRAMVNLDPSMTAPMPPIVWEKGAMPPPSNPPVSDGAGAGAYSVSCV